MASIQVQTLKFSDEDLNSSVKKHQRIKCLKTKYIAAVIKHYAPGVSSHSSGSCRPDVRDYVGWAQR